MKKRFAKRAIHLDFHTMPGIYDVGVEFDPRIFAQTLRDAGIDYVTVFARCNLGFAYYPTKIGIVHPGMQKDDLLGGMVTECHRQGIRVAAYFNAGLDHEHALRHRDWCKVNKSGQVAELQNMSHYFRKMCLNTGYKAYLLGMIEEVMHEYPVDGIFLDCCNLSPCYGAECIQGMKRLGINIDDDREAKSYYWFVTEKFINETRKLVHDRNANAFLYFNGLPYDKQPTHIELEVLPTGGLGYDYLPWVIRYARTLGKPLFTMTGRFHKTWADFGGLRPEHSLLFDLYNSIANGGTCSIGDHMHPRGSLNKTVYDLVGKVYAKTKELDEFTDDAKPVAEIAIVEPRLNMYPGFYFDTTGIAGATRMLMELKCQFDVVDGNGNFDKYKVVILPDSVCVDDELKQKLQAHLKQNGFIISSAFAGLTADSMKFALEEYKISTAGPEENDPSFFSVEKEMAQDLPDFLTTIYEPGLAIQAEKGAKILAKLFKPYFNVGSWDWEHENLYTPPEADTGRPALIQSGNIFHFSFPVFKSYYNHALVAYRTLFRNCLEQAFPEQLIRHKNLPSFAQVTVTKQKKRMMVHILTYLPELRGKQMQVIEEPIVINNAMIGLRTNGNEKIDKVYLAPSGEEVKFAVQGNYAWAVIPEIKGYSMLVLEAPDYSPL